MNRQTVVRLESNDYYAYLNLDGTASVSDVKRNYRQLALQWHPDKHAGTDRSRATDIFQKIVEAHETLTDSNMRRTYDNIWGQRFRGRQRVVPEWARGAGRGKSRTASVDSCASLSGRGLSVERTSVERSINVSRASIQRSTQQQSSSKDFSTPPNSAPSPSTQQSKASSPEIVKVNAQQSEKAKQSESVNAQQPRSRPLSPPFLAPKRQRTPSPPQQKAQPPPVTPSHVVQARPAAPTVPRQTAPKYEPKESVASRRASQPVPGGSLRDSRRSLAAAAASSTRGYAAEREATFQQQEQENLKREAVDRKAIDGADFRKQLYEEHRKVSREEDDDYMPPARPMSTEEIQEQAKTERETFTCYVAHLVRIKQKRKEREKIDQQAEDTMDAALERERSKLTTQSSQEYTSSEEVSASRSTEASPRVATEPRPKARPKEGKSVLAAGTVTDGRWKCAECSYRNPVTKMRCEVCSGVCQAGAPCGSPELSGRRPPRKSNVSNESHDAEVKDETTASVWDVTSGVATVVGGGVVGLAGYTAQSVQDSWSSAISTLFSPFTRQAARPPASNTDWLCGRCGRTLRGNGSNLCSQCGAIQEDH